MRNYKNQPGNSVLSNLSRFVSFLLLALVLIAQVPVLNVQAAGTDLTLTKTVEGNLTTAQVGDIIRYRIHFACSNLTTPCGPMEITDVLQSGLTYIPAQSSVPAGFTMTESPAGTITITKDDNNLLDGSQYDAVIAVLVSYDLRPLPATINNTITGRIAPTGLPNWENTTPASALPITIGEANPYWAVTKTLSSPLVEPTVDTDVTYQINLCPTTPPPGEGNVGLSNITIVDTLPAGAAFVSASNGGAYAAGTGTVTWSVAGPIYPPNCVTRFVTVRYNSPAGTPPGPFLVGNNVTNTVDFDADYVPSTGTCTTPCTGSGGNINHDIDPIFEVPNYSKDDLGDPVGFTGTGRFILNLDTNDTNYPSNDLILVDNVPPQFRVLSVTSGGWSAAFQHVRAHIEYSTNNGGSYTAFPGSPALYNSSAVYAAPAVNITNVRWRFEYDPDGLVPYAYTQPGLPYTWAFTGSPEVRVTPRAVATTADPPSGAAMPAAAAGNTYTNCVQTTRTDSSGIPVMDPCSDETMTVQGSLVSLRVSKSETPGSSWDEMDDPSILSFVSDAKILPGDTVKYTITLELTERSSENLVNPAIEDTLPVDGASPVGPDFVFVRNGTATLDGGPVVQPVFTQAGQVIKWEWPSLTITPLPLGSRNLTVEFYGYVPRGQDPGTYVNNPYAVTDSTEVLCEIGSRIADSGDVDTDGNTAEFGCRNPDPYVVERSAALRGEKWIRSISPDNNQVVLASTFLPDASCPNGGTNGLTNIPTNSFTRFPCIAQAFPEGALSPNQFTPPPADTTIDDFEYNLRVFNDGNVPMLEYVLYDILPRVGDTGSGGVLVNTARASQFRPGLTGPIQFIQGPGGLTSNDFTIEYNYTINPCRPEVFDQPVGATVPGGCDNTWVPAGSVTDWSLVRSYRIRLNNDGTLSFPSLANAVPAGSELRFGVPMHIPSDAPPTGFDTDDALSHEIAWNSFSHVGSYDKDSGAPVVIEDLLASEPRKVGITVPERLSVGNRVWRDADNSGTINPPDDSAPGIAGVTVNLYRDADNNGVPDGAAINTTNTDTQGYFLFSNIPYDAANMNNNRYIIGVPAGNFGAGQPLESLRSSTGTPAAATYVTPISNPVDSADDGIDPVTPGQEVLSWAFTLQPGTEPAAEADLSNNNRDGLPGLRRGVNGERDNNSDLTIDFGFFGGTDVPFSIGNHVWKDNGQGGGVINDGIRQAGEPPVIGALARLYRDGNANGIPEAAEMIRTDLTDADGFYLFDNLDPGPYYVEIPASNFASGQPLAGWFSSQVTGTEDVGVPGNTNTPNMDGDDNGIDSNLPENTGIFSGVVVLTRGTNEQTGETHLSNDSSSAPGFNPTAGDGPGHIGRFGEMDTTSNVTVDFGFIPPMSLGNRVWIDDGAGTTPFRTGYNNGLQDGTEAGINGVRVELWRDTNGTPGLQVGGGTPDTFINFTTTDSAGYYLFERLQPGSNYFVHIPASNFTGSRPLVNYTSSADANQSTPPNDDTEDTDDNGVDTAAPATNGISSTVITMAYNNEPLTPANEIDINNSGAYGPNNVGTFGQEDNDSNLTIDFGFVRPPRSLGNYLWVDANNNGAFDVGELPVPAGVRVSLYQDNNGNGQPDDLGILGNTTDDWLAYDLTDANGYYLFDKLPPGRYVVGVDYTNFAVGSPLSGYASSKGYVDNASNNTDSRDNGVDRLQMGNPALSPYGILSTSINLTATPVNAPTGETGSGDVSVASGFNPTAGDGPNSRGRFGETNANSDLTIDFGFFIPMSLGNRVFRDDGTGGGTYNDGIMNGGEPPFANVRVELWRDANIDGVPDAGGFMDYDTTDAGGYYLFDALAPGSYVVLIPASNFTGTGPLVGYNTSTPTGSENAGVAGNPYTPNTDRDDNGLNVGSTPSAGGVRSGTISLVSFAEPAGETELSGQLDPGSPANLGFSPTGWDGPTPGSRGRWEESDDNSNLTIDFGFIPVYSLGNRVWLDTGGTTGTPNNGIMDGNEAGINGIMVNLYLDSNNDGTPDGPGIQTTNTDANGYYRFNDLITGTYIVEVVPPAGLGSTVDTDQDPDDNADLDDNGVITLTTGEVRSRPVTLGDLPEPTGEEPTPPNPDSANGEAPDAQSNRTVDFGFVGAVAIGNVVWFDTGAGYNNGIYEPADEVGVDDVTVQLFRAGGVEVPVGPDGILNTADDSPGGMLTSAGGYYRFDKLIPGDYYVYIPAAEFLAGGELYTYLSSSDSVPATTSQIADNNVDENGIDGTPSNPLTLTGIRSLTYTLTPGTMPVADDDTFYGGTLPDNNVNFTADFGFVESYSLGNRVWLDTNRDGIRNDGVEPGIQAVTVNLYRDTNNDDAPDGPIIHSVLTDADGYYRFDNLTAVNYIVEVVPLPGYASTIDAGDPDTDTDDDDDNGVIFIGSNVRSNAVTLGSGSIEPTAENNPGLNPDAANGEAPDARSNRTVDFGFITSNATTDKQLTGTIVMDNDPVTGNPIAGTDFTTGTQVAIGEILTYRVQLSIPSGATYTNLVAVDQLGAGLAFVGCDSVIAPSLTTTLAGGFLAACNPDINPTVAPQSTPDSETDAALVTFSLGNVNNSTADTQFIAITYRVIVLDVPGNRDGVGGLNNSVAWSWDGTSLPPVQATPVEVVEPDLSIDKEAAPGSAPYGTSIRFTIDIAHTVDSTVTAFDVTVTDTIPAGLTLDPATIDVTGSASTPGNFTLNFDLATNILTVTWAEFPLGATGRITFDAIFVGPAPVVNTANVTWTSLPIDPQPGGAPVILSAFNSFSTERWYDPADLTGVNIYGTSDFVTITLPRDTLPATGFAPGVESQVPPQPLNMKYAATGVYLEIPSLGIKLPIVGVPRKNGTWDVTWLGKQAGWLEGSAFPSWNGNSLLTSHVYDSNGLPGPFLNLASLKYGDRVIVHLGGQNYIFEVRSNLVVSPGDTSAFKHEDLAWLTLITCKEYDQATNTYKKRVVVRAVLVEVK